MKVLDFFGDTLLLRKASLEKHVVESEDRKNSELTDGFKNLLKTYSEDKYEISESFKAPMESKESFSQKESVSSDTTSKDVAGIEQENIEESYKGIGVLHEEEGIRVNSDIGKVVDEYSGKKVVFFEGALRGLMELGVSSLTSGNGFKQGQENNRKISNGNPLYNLEVYLLSLIRIVSEFSRTNEIPPDVRQKISELRSRIFEGKVNVVEISNLLAEIKKLSKSSEFYSKLNLEGFFKEFEQILVKFKEFSDSERYVFSNKFNDYVISERIILNDHRQSDNRNVEKKEIIRGDNFNISTPIKGEGIKSLNINPQGISSSPNNFFVQFNMLANAVSEFSGRVILNLRNNVNEMKMILFPPELGKVSVKFETTSDGKLVGNIVVSSREAYTLFQEHLNVIKENLTNQGFNVVRIDINFDSMLSNFGSERFGKGENTQMSDLGKFYRSSNKKEEYEYASRATSYHDGTISLYA